MPHFILSHGPLGPLIDLYVGVSLPRFNALRVDGQTPPTPILAKALVDTGASNSAVDVTVIAALGVSAKRIASIITPSTGAVPHKCHTFDVAIYIPISKDTVPWGKTSHEVTRAELKHQGFDVLIGRDILAEAIFIYDGKSSVFTLCF
jgi:hypothetical protein